MRCSTNTGSAGVRFFGAGFGAGLRLVAFAAGASLRFSFSATSTLPARARGARRAIDRVGWNLRACRRLLWRDLARFLAQFGAKPSPPARALSEPVRLRPRVFVESEAVLHAVD